MVGTPDLAFHHISIEELKDLWNKNRIQISKKYQRSYVWKPPQRRELVESIVRGYSIGVLVIWTNKKNELEVLDGQQRIRTIIEYLNGRFADNYNKKFNDLGLTEQSEMKAYSMYYLELKSHLSEEEVSDIFTRLQEGTPLNVAEKVHAAHSAFKDSFMKIFTANRDFFSKINDYRFKARFLAAQFLLLELRTDFDRLIFPNLSYTTFKEVIKENNTEFQKPVYDKCSKNIRFMASVLLDQIHSISPRDLISIYMLTSYLNRKQIDVTNLSTDFQQFVSDFLSTLNMFSVYDVTPPTGMEPYIFDKFKAYKQEGRRATSAGSIEKRFDFILSEYKEMYPNSQFREEPKTGRRATVDPYLVLKQFENNLRAFIEHHLGKVDKNWWTSRVPSDVSGNADQRMKDDNRTFPWYNKADAKPINYINFADYAKIINRKDNWRTVFKHIFHDNEVISSKLKELDTLRNGIAHNRELTAGQKERLRILVEDVNAFIK